MAVTEERVGAAFAAIAGNEFAMEPMAQGPGKVAKVSANVTIKEPQVSRNVADSITFDIPIPLLIDLLVDLRLDKQRFRVDGDIALSATARAAEPQLLIVDVAKPRPSDITVHVSSKSIRASYCASWPASTRRSGASSRNTSPRKSRRRNRKRRKSLTWQSNSIRPGPASNRSCARTSIVEA